MISSIDVKFHTVEMPLKPKELIDIKFDRNIHLIARDVIYALSALEMEATIIEIDTNNSLGRTGQSLNDICEMFKDKNYIICTTTFAEWNEASKISEAGFTDISNFLNYKNSAIPFIYPNEIGNIVIEHFVQKKYMIK